MELVCAWRGLPPNLQHINLQSCGAGLSDEAPSYALSSFAVAGCPNSRHINLRSFGQVSDEKPSGIEHELPEDSQHSNLGGRLQ